MNQVMIEELDRLDVAFTQNRLLGTFDREARSLVEPFVEYLDLAVGETVLTPGQQVRASVFPIGPTMISMLVELGDDRSIEVASIGREGAVGGIISCGHAPAYSHAKVQVAGPAIRLPMRALEDAKSSSRFINNIFCRYSDYLLAQVMQSVACNAFHSIAARAAGWLLSAQDRAGDRIALTQDALAGLLGVQRTSVNAVIGSLQDEGLITTRRGLVEVVDRAGLQRRACGCYGRVERHFGDIIGVSGSGGSPACG
jgi:CRP-like cAMP-binding protein